MCRLPEDLRQPHDRQHPAVDDVPQHHARPDRRQLVHVAHEQEAGAGRQWPSPVASIRTWLSPAQARIKESTGMPIFWAIWSAVRCRG